VGGPGVAAGLIVSLWLVCRFRSVFATVQLEAAVGLQFFLRKRFATSNEKVFFYESQHCLMSQFVTLEIKGIVIGYDKSTRNDNTG
jgi:hypothetical protein